MKDISGRFLYVILGFLICLTLWNWFNSKRIQTNEKVIYKKITVFTPIIKKDKKLVDSLIAMKRILETYKNIIKQDSFTVKQLLTEKKKYEFENDTLKLSIYYYGIFQPYKLTYIIKPMPIETVLTYKEKTIEKIRTNWKTTLLFGTIGFIAGVLISK